MADCCYSFATGGCAPVAQWFIHDDRFGRTYFASRAARDAAFEAAPYIDQKHWWLGHVDDPVLRSYP